jgi:tRNA threonylcarbamoyladenosine biosynthesis protein TsaB
VILAFDTATSATAVALCGGSAGDLELRDDPPAGSRPRHTSRLLPLIAQAMQQAGATWGDIDRIAVGIGPGTFTGLRIGVATARALAGARAIPLAGVSTLRSLARNAPADAGAVAAVLDARRGEVFAAIWRGDETLLAPCALAPEDLAAELSSAAGNVLAIGDGALAFRAVLEPSGAFIPEDRAELHRVTAINHCVLARDARAGAPDEVRPDEVRPDYLRLPDAEIARRSR